MGRNRGKGCGICGGPVRAKRLCEKHYKKNYRNRREVRFRQRIRRKFK